MNICIGRTSPPARGFTLVELLVAIAVLTVLILLVAQLLNNATAVATLGEKRMDADAQARTVFDRMAIDFSRMLKRADVDYYLKSPAHEQTGNDQIAFYSEVPGYYSSDDYQSPTSLVSYRVNRGNARLERMGKGLLFWNGDPAHHPSMVYLPRTIEDTWKSATDQSSNADYEVMGPQVFRFEYGYLLKGRKLPDGTTLPSVTSSTPWDTRPQLGHSAVEGLRDIAAIIVYIAVIDPKSRVLVIDPAGRSLVSDLLGSLAGELEGTWQNTIDRCALPRPAKSSIRIYRRVFPL
jgi:prepilin-type N-terminal cleavage/methylation domain-containing protein